MIEYCVEKLYHFSCNLCKRWFSVGDWTKSTKLTCPFCNVTQSVVEKDVN